MRAKRGLAANGWYFSPAAETLGAILLVIAVTSIVLGCDRSSADETQSDGAISPDAGVVPDGATEQGAGNDTGPDCGCDQLEQCFGGQLCVAKLVAVTEGYSIDATEVTRDQYAAWLATNPAPGGQIAGCVGWNDSFVPINNWPERACDSPVWPPADKGDHPVVCVDWCDAYAYCKAVGKRLCGKIGGGANDYEDFDDPAKSQWYNACSSGGKYNYPYGGDLSVDVTDGFEAHTCNGDENGVGTTLPVAASTGCQSPESGYAGVFDLSGNVREWEDSCVGEGSVFDPCRIRGGSYHDPAYSNLQCRYGFYSYWSHAWGDIGFRCCAP